jgi:hypothetical protein
MIYTKDKELIFEKLKYDATYRQGFTDGSILVLIIMVFINMFLCSELTKTREQILHNTEIIRESIEDISVSINNIYFQNICLMTKNSGSVCKVYTKQKVEKLDQFNYLIDQYNDLLNHRLYEYKKEYDRIKN